MIPNGPWCYGPHSAGPTPAPPGPAVAARKLAGPAGRMQLPGRPVSEAAGAEADESAYKRQEHNADVTEFAELPGRGHSLTIDGGRAEVARTALDFIKRFT